jgi:hypothetical protein
MNKNIHIYTGHLWVELLEKCNEGYYWMASSLLSRQMHKNFGRIV